jgi:hypothetical protein
MKNVHKLSKMLGGPNVSWKYLIQKFHNIAFHITLNGTAELAFFCLNFHIFSCNLCLLLTVFPNMSYDTFGSPSILDNLWTFFINDFFFYFSFFPPLTTLFLSIHYYSWIKFSLVLPAFWIIYGHFQL